MNTLGLLSIVVLATVPLCAGQAEHLHIMGYQKLPMAMKIYVDQYGFSGPPRATYTPVGAAPASSMQSSLLLRPMHSQLSRGFSGSGFSGSGSLGGLTGLLRQFGGGQERELPSGANAPEIEGISNQPSMMDRLRISFGRGGGSQMNFDPTMLLMGGGGSAAPSLDTEGGGGTGGSMFENMRMSMAGSQGANSLNELFQSPRRGQNSMFGSNASNNMGQTLSDIRNAGQNPEVMNSLREFMQGLGSGGSGRVKRAVAGNPPVSHAAMNKLLAKLKLQLKQTLMTRGLPNQSPSTNSLQTQRSGISLFGAPAVTTPRQKTVVTTPASNAMPDPRRTDIRKFTRTSKNVNSLPTINRTSNQSKPIVSGAKNTKPLTLSVKKLNSKPIPRARFAKAKPAINHIPLKRKLPIADTKVSNSLSSFLTTGRTRAVQSGMPVARTIQCVPGRTVSPEVTIIGPTGDIHRYECVIQLQRTDDSLLGSFSVQQGESAMTCLVDLDRVQILGDIIQPSCAYK